MLIFSKLRRDNPYSPAWLVGALQQLDESGNCAHSEAIEEFCDVCTLVLDCTNAVIWDNLRDIRENHIDTVNGAIIEELNSNVSLREYPSYKFHEANFNHAKIFIQLYFIGRALAYCQCHGAECAVCLLNSGSMGICSRHPLFLDLSELYTEHQDEIDDIVKNFAVERLIISNDIEYWLRPR